MKIRSKIMGMQCLGLGMLAMPILGVQENRPNILWITNEDHGPHLGAYGDDYAHTPNLDALATRSLRYSVAWSNGPICAPARTAIITGVHPTSVGGHHMRSDVRLPEEIVPYPQLLREAGYYCTNNAKEDYNLSGFGTIWDESSRTAHYRNRGEGQPFFAVFNLHESHEFRIHDRTDLPHHDPEKAPVPPYHPDHPEVRRDWAQYYHSISNADERIGVLLAELEEDGLAESTIVFFYSDHGSGMARHKRWPYNSGLHVPLIIHIPDAFRHLAPEDYNPGEKTQRPVSFVDLAPTLLSLIGKDPPPWMQGRAFLGPHEREPKRYLFGFGGRQDERYDMIRSVRNDRYIYLRNYLPHKIYGQRGRTLFLAETTRAWHRLYHAGELQPPQTHFWEEKPPEELYDLVEDPHEVDNLVSSPEHQEILHEMRMALRQHVLNIRDVGYLPEAEMHRRKSTMTIYEMGLDPDLFPMEAIFEAAETAAGRNPDDLSKLESLLQSEDPGIRYWAMTGLLIRGNVIGEAGPELARASLDDGNPDVRIVAAELLLRHGSAEDRGAARKTLLELAPPDRNGVYVGLTAMNVIADLDESSLVKIRPFLAEMAVEDPNAPPRANDYVHRLVSAVLAEPAADDTTSPAP